MTSTLEFSLDFRSVTGALQNKWVDLSRDDLPTYIAQRKIIATSCNIAIPGVFWKNLQFLHNTVTATEGLLETAYLQCRKLCAGEERLFLEQYYGRHLEEERGHLDWLECDMRNLGVERNPLDSIAMALIGTQYYLINHVHPSALLGYLLVFEGEPVSISKVEALEDIYGSGNLTFLRRHAETDVVHREELFWLMKRLNLDRIPALWFSLESSLFYLSEAAKSWLGGR
jgi:hypothetical protein